MTDLSSSALASANSVQLPHGEGVAQVRGAALRYRVAGQGPVLVLQAPGWGIGGDYFRSLSALEATFTVVTYDPRGSGASSHAPPAMLHVDTFVADLEALREHLGLESFALAGHSHGGLIAAHYALRHPGRVSALVLIDAQLVGVRGHPAERVGTLDPERVPEIGAAYAYLERVGGFERMFTAATDRDATEFLVGIAPLYFRDPRHAPTLAAMLSARDIPVRTMQAVSATDGGFPLTEGALRACPVPTLVVTGRYDAFCPTPAARHLAETMPDARYAVFEESGHLPWLEEREAFLATVVGFLQAQA